MSILLRSDPNSSTSPIVVLPELIDLFNPTKHNLWRHNPRGPNYMTAGLWRSIFKCLFLRENLKNFTQFYKPIFFNTSTPNPEDNILEEALTQIIDTLSDDALWFMNFCKIKVFQNTSQLSLNTIEWCDHSHDSNFSFSWDTQTFNYSTPAQLASKIEELARNFNTFVDSKHDKRCYDYSCSLHPAFSTFFSMVSGIKYVFDNHNYYTATTCYNMLTTNPDATLTFTRNFSNVTISIPITYANRNQLYQVFPYSTDITRLLPNKKKLPTEGTPVHIGVELEVSTDYDVAHLIDASAELFFIAKQDSSITGKKLNRMELVTVPASFKYLKKQYAHWFNNLDYRNFDCTTETNNGMHVHIDRLAFDDDYHIRNFCWFINNPANTPFIVAMSDRGSLEAMRNYTPFLQFPSHSTRTTAFKNCHRLLDGHRGATNLKNGWANAKTVEVRIFRGIVSYAAIVKNLEFVESLFHFTKSLSSYRELSLACYIKWLFNTPVNRFPILKKFVQSHDLDRFLLIADIKDIIFNETDPEKIAKVLMASKLPITNDHITYLNRGRKRTFTLNKDTGQINVIKTNIFKLADLDIDLAKRISGNVTRAA